MLIVMIFTLVTFLVGCTTKSENTSSEESSAATERSYTDFIDSGKIIAVQTGSVHGIVAEDILKGTAQEFSNPNEMFVSLRNGRVDAVLLDSDYLKPFIDSGQYPEFEFFFVPEDVFLNRAAPIFHTEELRDKYNEWLAIVSADGTRDEIIARWIGVSLPNEEDVPFIDLQGGNGTLRVADTFDYPPFIYYNSQGLPTGLDYEMTSRFAEHLGMNLEPLSMSYEAVLVSVKSGKVDMSACLYTVTEERSENIIFGDPFIYNQVIIVALKENAPQTEESTNFIAWLKNGIENNLITDNRWKMIVDGLGVTLIIALGSQIFGTILGCLICFLLGRKSRIARGFGRLYCNLINGIPVVVLLMVIYYIVFGNSTISNVFVAIVAFSMVVAANVAKTLDGAIKTVDPVEIEAARSIGFSAMRAFRLVTLPQAVKRALPGYVSGFVELVKATAIVGFIAIQDLTRAADIIRSRTYDAFFPLILIAVIYLIVTAVIILIFKRITKNVS